MNAEHQCDYCKNGDDNCEHWMIFNGEKCPGCLARMQINKEVTENE